MNKTANSQTQITRQQICNWIHSILNDIPVSIKIEQLGKGVIYCRIMNHYFPGIILINRIIWTPKSEYQNILNLKFIQNALAQLKINIQIDPIRLSKQKINDNWNFITALYKYLNQSNQETYTMHSQTQQKMQFNYYPQMIAPHPMPVLYTPKRTIQQIYPQTFYQGLNRPQFFTLDQNIQVQNSFYNASKYSVGKLQGMSMPVASSPSKGKWSVNSHMFQNNLAPIIDRIKQILLKPFHNTQKIRQIKILLNIPLNQQVIVKVEEDENTQIIVTNPTKTQSSIPQKKEKPLSKELSSETAIPSREEIKLTE